MNSREKKLETPIPLQELEKPEEPEEPIEMTGITEMTPDEVSSLVAASDGHLYFESSLKECYVSPVTRVKFTGPHYKTYAVQDIIHYTNWLKKERETLLADKIKRIKQQLADQSTIGHLKNEITKLVAENKQLKRTQDIYLDTLESITKLGEFKNQPKRPQSPIVLPASDLDNKQKLRIDTTATPCIEKNTLKNTKVTTVSYFKINKNFSREQITHKEALNILLFNAIESNRIDKVAEALKKGADIEAHDDECYQTPLAKAIIKIQPKMIEFLLKSGANPDNEFKVYSTSNLQAPILNILNFDNLYNLQAIKILIEYKANLNVQNNDGNTPLHGAVILDRLERIEVVKLLLKNKANPLITNTSNKNPLQYLASKEIISKEMQKVLEFAQEKQHTSTIDDYGKLRHLPS